MKKLIYLISFFVLFFANAQEKAVPYFKNGEAQVVEAFKDESNWIRHDLWVETTFDSDYDGKKIECMLALLVPHKQMMD